MARIEVPAGDGREATRIWQLAPHMGAGLSGMAAVCLSLSLAHAQTLPPSLLIPERVSQITVTPVVADAGVARQITVSGFWPGCPHEIPHGADSPPMRTKATMRRSSSLTMAKGRKPGGLNRSTKTL